MRGAYTFGKATTSDLAELVDLLEEQIATHPLGHLLIDRDKGGWAPFLVRVMELGVILVARAFVLGRPEPEHRPILGAIAAVALPHPLSGDLYADEVMFYVLPAHRGGQIGPKLLEQLERWACTKSVRVLKCSSPVGSNLGDHYKRLGYLEVETAFAKVL